MENFIMRSDNWMNLYMAKVCAIMLAASSCFAYANTPERSPIRLATVNSTLVAQAYSSANIDLTIDSSPEVARAFSVRVVNGELLLGVSAPAYEYDDLPPARVKTIPLPPLSAGTYPIRILDSNGEAYPPLFMSFVFTAVAPTITVANLLYAAPATPVAITPVPGIRYFLTANSADVTTLLSFNTSYGLFPLWRLADGGFKAWPATGDAPTAALPVCRFFSPQFSTHFYSAKPEECALLRSLPSQWNDEGTAFRALLPSDGVCGYGTEPVYRLFSAEFKNHRYTTQADTYRAMRLAGWAGEGAAFCSPLN